MVYGSFFLPIELHDRFLFKGNCHRLFLLTNNNSEVTELPTQHQTLIMITKQLPEFRVPTFESVEQEV